MYPDAIKPAFVTDRQRAGGDELRVSELNRAERLVVCAIRAGASRSDHGGIAIAEHERDELRDLRRVVERYLQLNTPGAPRLQDDGTDARLGVFERHTLHALACVQAGLLGEAWKSLVPIWGAAEAGKALLQLQEVAAALQLRGHRVERWQFDPAVFREAALI
jgi:hypothetical protein